MNNIFSIIRPLLTENNAEYSAVSIQGKTYVIFALPYTQLSAPPVGYAFVDSYYVASNRAYFLRKELAVLLEAAGFTISVCDFSYKHLAVASGLGKWLRSTLVANKIFGTRMALEIICADGVFADEITVEELYKKPQIAGECESCTICRRLCPGGCIGDNCSFDKEKCIRSRQDNGFFSDDTVAISAGVNLWGCDTCQRFCPVNKHLGEREMTDTEKELFRLDNLFNAFSNGKKGCEPYRDILGSNYLRPSRLMSLTLNAMMNSPDWESYIPYAQKAVCHSDERVKKAAQRLLNKRK